jgi:hypothetical protein
MRFRAALSIDTDTLADPETRIYISLGVSPARMITSPRRKNFRTRSLFKMPTSRFAIPRTAWHSSNRTRRKRLGVGLLRVRRRLSPSSRARSRSSKKLTFTFLFRNTLVRVARWPARAIDTNFRERISPLMSPASSRQLTKSTA